MSLQQWKIYVIVFFSSLLPLCCCLYRLWRKIYIIFLPQFYVSSHLTWHSLSDAEAFYFLYRFRMSLGWMTTTTMMSKGEERNPINYNRCAIYINALTIYTIFFFLIYFPIHSLVFHPPVTLEFN